MIHWPIIFAFVDVILVTELISRILESRRRTKAWEAEQAYYASPEYATECRERSVQMWGRSQMFCRACSSMVRWDVDHVCEHCGAKDQMAGPPVFVA